MGFKPGLLNSQVISTLGQSWKAEWKRNLLSFSMPFPPPDNTFRETGLAACLPPSLMPSWTRPDRFKTFPGQQRQAGVSRGLPGPFALFSLLTHSLALTAGSGWGCCQHMQGRHQIYLHLGLFQPSALSPFESTTRYMWFK